METPRKNKRTNCTPKQIPSDSQITTNLLSGSNNDDQINKLTNSPQYSNIQVNATKSSRLNFQNTIFFPINNSRKQINYQTQNNAKAISEVSEKVAKEKSRDNLFFTSASTQSFQDTVAYFPGKNLKDIRRVLNSKKIKDILNGRSITHNSNFNKKQYHFTEKTAFGKHLNYSKKSKKLKLVPMALLNTIDEVSENIKSNESIKINADKLNEIGETSSTKIQFSDMSQTSKHATENIEKKKETSNQRTLTFNNDLNKCVSYLFHEDKNISERAISIKDITNSSPAVDIVQTSIKGVFQLRDIYEKLSKNEESVEKPEIICDKKSIISKLINFEHEIACGECRKMLKDVIESESIPKEEMESAISETTHARRIVDSLIKEICKRASENQRHISWKVMTKNTNTISNLHSGRRSRISRADILYHKQYKKFVLLTLAISIILYCFYCRLNEKKK